MNPQLDGYFSGSRQRDQDPAAAGRRQLGLEIAATAKIGKNRAGYVVPSQSGTGSYLVNLDGEPFCTCPISNCGRSPASTSSRLSSLSNGRVRRETQQKPTEGLESPPRTETGPPTTMHRPTRGGSFPLY